MTPPPLLKLGDAVELLQGLGIRGGKRRLAQLVEIGKVQAVVLPGQARRYYQRDSILALANMPNGQNMPDGIGKDEG